MSHACRKGGAAIFRTSTSKEGILRGRTSSRLRPMAMATSATAIGRPLPIWPYVLPSRDEPTPRAARVVARPSENETALQQTGICYSCCGSRALQRTSTPKRGTLLKGVTESSDKVLCAHMSAWKSQHTFPQGVMAERSGITLQQALMDCSGPLQWHIRQCSPV